MFITSLNKDNIFNLSKVSYIFIKCVGNVHSEIDDWETKLLGKSACNCKKKTKRNVLTQKLDIYQHSRNTNRSVDFLILNSSTF
jgi:hypothetical protein